MIDIYNIYEHIINLKYRGYFSAYLRDQFSSLEEAKVFINKWFNEMDQTICLVNVDMGITTYSIGFREMAHHVSLALEDKENYISGKDYRFYYDTKYGSELYFCIGTTDYRPH